MRRETAFLLMELKIQNGNTGFKIIHLNVNYQFGSVLHLCSITFSRPNLPPIIVFDPLVHQPNWTHTVCCQEQMPGIFACRALGQGCGGEHTAYCSGIGLCGFYISKITLRFSQEMSANRCC